MPNADTHPPEHQNTLNILDKTANAQKAVSIVQSGDTVFIGTACATPRKLLEALENKRDIDDVILTHFLTESRKSKDELNISSRFEHRVFFVGMDVRDQIETGRADYIPISVSQVASLMENGRLTPDVAMIQVSPPNEHGFVSLGVSVDVTLSAVRNAKKVIAEVNPNMPQTMGESFISVDDIEYLVTVEDPVIEYLHVPADDVAKQIARYVARIIDDGSTLQIGLGQIPNEMLKYLDNRSHLGIHSDVITEPIVDLIDKGVITGKEKTLHKGQIVASYCMGTKRLYETIDRNPMFSFFPIEYVCNPSVIADNNKLVSVTQAFAVDLMGQVCSDQYQGKFYGGVSTQPEFLRGAAESPGGKPIICLRSTTDDGTESRIRPLLEKGEGVTIARSDVHYVITEYGVAYLFNKSIRERALALIEIAHPSFREQLLEAGKKLGYLRPDQKLRSKTAYPESEERKVTLRNGTKILLRPAKASDVEAVQQVFYSLSEKDIYTRFFTNLKSLSVSKAEYLCNMDYETEMAFVAIKGDREDNFVVGTGCYYLNPATNLAEVAYMIRPEWQQLGLGGALQKRMTEYAISKGIRGFVAEILMVNTKMINLAKAGDNASCHSQGNAIEVTTIF